MSISVEAAASIDALIEKLRADVKRLTKERDDAQCEVKRLERQHLADLDTIFDLEQRLVVRDHREG